jgi:hypothetical protein
MRAPLPDFPLRKVKAKKDHRPLPSRRRGPALLYGSCACVVRRYVSTHMLENLYAQYDGKTFEWLALSGDSMNPHGEYLLREDGGNFVGGA